MNISVYQTGELGVNTYYAVCEKTMKGFLIDPGGYDKRIANKVKSENVSLEYIILTHGHGDHIGGVKAFMKEFPEAKLVASVAEKEMLVDPVLNFSSYFGEELVFYPDIFVKDGDVISVGELELNILHTPGHSPGGICILVEKILFSGDTLFAQSIGRTDFQGSSFSQLKKSIHEKLFVLPDDTRVLPGHMGETDIGFEKRHNPFV